MSKASALDELYPFLTVKGADDGAGSAALDDRLLHSIADKAAASRETNARFFAEQAPALLAAAKAMADRFALGGTLYTLGNGGSSCDAAHLAVEFMHPITAGRPALRAVNLTADVTLLTALGNDIGFENAFARQIVASGTAGDILAGFSTSGQSRNLLNAFIAAKERGMATIGFAGGDGGQMATLAAIDHCLIVPSSSVHRIQESHLVAYHVLWDLVHSLLAGRRGSAGELQ